VLTRSGGGDHFFFLELRQHSFSLPVQACVPLLPLFLFAMHSPRANPMAIRLPALGKAGVWRPQGGTGWEATRGGARATVGEVRALMPFPRGATARWPTCI
jgi:hypothetical protein